MESKGLVNATGPWVKEFFDDGLKIKSPYGIRLIKGAILSFRVLMMNHKRTSYKMKITVLYLLSRGWMNFLSSAPRE